jgi:predicted metal-dependent phosphoesterase TrpH
MLGYLFDPADEALRAETERIRAARMTRARDMVERIGEDYSLTWEDVLAHTREGATVGRPHIADALVALGYAPDRSAAFAGILHWRAGGVPVLAHPATGGVERIMPEAQLSELVDAGLFGLEIDHRGNTEEGRERLHELAKRYGLRVTGSSDYHGDGKPNRLGENQTDPRVLSDIIAEATGSQPTYG